MARTIWGSLKFVGLSIALVLAMGGSFVGGFATGYYHGETEARARYLRYEPVPDGDFHPFRTPRSQE